MTKPGKKKDKKPKAAGADKQQDTEGEDQIITEVESCGTCNVVIRDEENEEALQCDGFCKRWIHRTCTDVSKDEYKVLSPTKININWYCDSCASRIEDIFEEENDMAIRNVKASNKQLEQDIKRIEGLMETLRTQATNDRNTITDRMDRNETQIEEIRKKNDKKCDSEQVHGIISYEMRKENNQTATSTLRTNAADNNRELGQRTVNKGRERNIIMFRAEENHEDTSEERLTKDKDLVKEVFRTCNIRLLDESIERAIRLGKKEEGTNRPLLISFKDEEDKRELFRNITELRGELVPNTIKNISIANDLSPEERAKSSKLAKEAKELQDADPLNFYKVRGPPWNMEIRKVART